MSLKRNVSATQNSPTNGPRQNNVSASPNSEKSLEKPKPKSPKLWASPNPELLKSNVTPTASPSPDSKNICTQSAAQSSSNLSAKKRQLTNRNPAKPQQLRESSTPPSSFRSEGGGGKGGGGWLCRTLQRLNHNACRRTLVQSIEMNPRHPRRQQLRALSNRMSHPNMINRRRRNIILVKQFQ